MAADDSSSAASAAPAPWEDVASVAWDASLDPHVALADTAHGAFRVLRNDDPIGKSMLRYGEWAENELHLLRALVRPGSTVVDVGANCGTHAIAFATAVGEGGRVLAVEPQQRLAELLAANARDLGRGRVRILRAAAGSAPGRTWFPERDPGARGNSGAVSGHPHGSAGDRAVPVVRLDDRLDDVRDVSLVKIDVEGAEAEVLRGLEGVLRRERPVLYVEANTIEGAARSIAAVEPHGYEWRLHRAASFRPENHRGAAENVFGFASETSLLGVPRERSAVFDELHEHVLLPVPTLDALAIAIAETPRYGDASDHDRMPAALRDELLRRSETEAVARELATQEASRLSAKVDELARESDSLRASLQKSHAANVDLRTSLGEARRTAQDAEHQAHRLERELAERRSSIAWSAFEGFRRLELSLRNVRSSKLAKSYKRNLRRSRRLRQAKASVRRIQASGLFDVDFYLAQAAPRWPWASLDPIRHYLVLGADHGLDPHPLFSTSEYVARYADVKRSFMNPLVHFLRHGGMEKRDPSPRFSTAAYLAKHPELRESGENPLVHFVRTSKARGADPTASTEWSSVPLAPRPLAPSEEEWASLPPRRVDGAPRVDVIVPVYLGRDETLRCLHRVLSATNVTPYELVVIDDASPDPTLSAELRALAGRGLFTYLANETNRGFVGTVNRGMRLHVDRDVVLLNSDAEPYRDWLDRLTAAAYRFERVGSVTPLSNAATICSYPTFLVDNHVDLPFEHLDELCSELNAETTVEAPSGVGFCMYVRRDCLDAVGLFDEESFGKGYGEENDFCQRAEERGWPNLIAADVFVRHVGGCSFLESKRPRVEAALAKLAQLHPGYERKVHDFIVADPLLPARRALDLARLRERLGGRALAMLTHRLGGGTERHVIELAQLARAEGVETLLLRPSPSGDGRIVVDLGPETALFPNLPTFDLRTPSGRARLVTTLETLGIRHLHVHHLIGLSASAPEDFVALAREHPALTFDVTVHDYAPICPRINLIGDGDVYCGEPDVSSCESCVARLGSRYEISTVSTHRHRHAELLRAARKVFVPDADVARRMLRYVPDVSFVVAPHPEWPSAATVAPPSPRSSERHTVVVLGAIGVHKGFEVLVACAVRARARGLPLDFVVVGQTCDDDRARAAGVEITGAYSTDEEALAAIARVGGDSAFFPAVWPETYSYTLSLALRAGLPPLAFAFGAIESRARELEAKLLLPLESMSDPDWIVTAIAEFAKRPHRPPPPPAAFLPPLASYYDDRA